MYRVLVVCFALSLGFAGMARAQSPSLSQQPISQAEQTLLTALQGQAASDALTRSAVQAYAAEKDAKIKDLEAQLVAAKKQLGEKTPEAPK